MWIIGDIHAKRWAVEAALALPGPKVFLGDLMDAYGEPTIAEQLRLIQLVVDAPDTICLLGNHEASYLDKVMRCSGYQAPLSARLRKTGLLERIRNECQPFLYFPDDRLLLSHAGLTRQIWDVGELSHATVEATLSRWCHENPLVSPYWWIGRCRGGGHPTGGLLWCDWRQEFLPVSGLNQIVGHTKVFAVNQRVGEESWNFNIDCLDTTSNILEWEPGWPRPRVHELAPRRPP